MAEEADRDHGSAAATPEPLPLDPSSAAIKKILDRTSVGELRRLIEQGQAAQKVVQILEAASVHGEEPPTFGPSGKGVGTMPCPEGAALDLEQGKGIPAECIDPVLTEGTKEHMDGQWRREELQRVEDRIRPSKPLVDPDRTVGGQVTAWVSLQQAAHVAGNISAGRFDAYARNVAVFRDWIGGDREVTAITALKLEEFYTRLCKKVGQKTYSPSYAKSIFGATKQFVKRLAELGLIPLPGNIASKKFKFDDGPKEIETFTADEVRKLLAACDGFSGRTKLYLLLMLNCGMYQNDIAELKQTEVDWEQGTVKRPRSKTPKGPKVTYRLWPETFELLRKYRSDDPALVLTTERGKALVEYEVRDDKLRRYDVIQSAYERLTKRAGIRKPLKVFRKTSASMLENHEVYGRYVQYFLAHSPGTVAEKHYTRPSDEQFFAALAWLRTQLLGQTRCSGDERGRSR